MSGYFLQQLALYERSKTRVRNHYRRDGSRECQEQVILTQGTGSRALNFVKIWFDESGNPIWQQESELCEADDCQITRRTYGFDAFGKQADGVVELIKLSRRSIDAPPSAHLFATPDAALLGALNNWSTTDRALPSPRRSAVTSNQQRQSPTGLPAPKQR